MARIITPFLSTPSARRATCWAKIVLNHVEISIHALREEGDWAVRAHPSCRVYFYPRPPRGGRLFSRLCIPTNSNISIHALREEGDDARRWAEAHLDGFLSTPSARRATKRALAN